MKDDFRGTGKCNVEMGKENFMELQVSWAVQKNSPFKDTLNQRLKTKSKYSDLSYIFI